MNIIHAIECIKLPNGRALAANKVNKALMCVCVCSAPPYIRQLIFLALHEVYIYIPFICFLHRRFLSLYLHD